MKKDMAIITEFKKRKGLTEQRLGKQWANTRKCQAFYAGDFMAYEDKIQFNSQDGKKRATVKINTVKPYVNAVNGFLIQNRSDAQYSARMENEVAQQLYSKYTNALKDYLRENANADQVESQCDKDMLIAGYGVQETALTYGDGYMTSEPGGTVTCGRIDPLTSGWDPYAQAPNVMDKRWVYYAKEFDIEDALRLFQGSTKEDFDDVTTSQNGGDYQYYQNGGVYDKIRVGPEFVDPKGDVVKVYFYQWYEVETFYEAINPIYNLQTPEAVAAAQMELDMIAAEYPDEIDFDPRSEKLVYSEAMKGALDDLFEDMINPVEFNRKVFYGAVLSGNTVFSKFRSSTQQDFTIQIKTGDYDAKNNIWVGMVNSMMEPTLYYNKALTELMFIIGANSKGGVMVEEDAVEDIEEFSADYAKTDAVIVVNPGALAGGKIAPKKEPQTMTGYENVITLMDAAMVQVNGIDKTFLGSSENRAETALLQRRRIKQITATLANYVDSILLFQKMNARVFLDLMRIYAENNEGSLFRLLGPDGGAEYIRISKDKLMNEYEVVISEGLTTAEEKQESLDTMITMGDKLIAINPQASMLIYAKAVKYMPIDPDDKQELMQAITGGQEQQIDPAYVQGLEATIQQLQSEQARATVENIASNTAFNMAKAEEARKSAQVKEATTIKTLAEADRTETETELAKSTPPGAESVSVTL